MAFELQNFQNKDLVFVYANRFNIQNVANILGVSAQAMAASIGAETQNIFKGTSWTPGGAFGLWANIYLDNGVMQLSHEAILDNYNKVLYQRELE